MKVVSGKWVDAERIPEVAKAREVFRCFEEKTTKEDCYAATASLISVRLISVWMLMMKAKVEDIVMLIADVERVFLNAKLKGGEVVLAQPPPEWKSSNLMSVGKKVIWKLRKASYGMRTSPKRWQEHLGEILKERDFVTHPLDACVYVKKVEDSSRTTA